MVQLEGVDFSATAHGDWPRLAAALKAAGKRFAGRYAVNDKSPGGRGITAAEYRALTDAGVDTFVYWQTTTNWMLGGFAAGASGARNAQENIEAAGMPPTIPVYFACDFDAEPEQQWVIDECLRGAASVLGFDRVGLYAGYWPLKRAMENKACRWFCQTSAWSGGMILPGIHLYQYAYNQYIDGTNCDWVRAYQANYGQASKFTAPAKPQPHPIWWDDLDVGAQRSNAGAVVIACRGEVAAKRRVRLRQMARAGAPTVHVMEVGEKGTIRGTWRNEKGQKWAFVEYAPGKVGRAPLSAFTPSSWPTL